MVVHGCDVGQAAGALEGRGGWRDGCGLRGLRLRVGRVLLLLLGEATLRSRLHGRLLLVFVVVVVKIEARRAKRRVGQAEISLDGPQSMYRGERGAGSKTPTAVGYMTDVVKQQRNWVCCPEGSQWKAMSPEMDRCTQVGRRKEVDVPVDAAAAEGSKKVVDYTTYASTKRRGRPATSGQNPSNHRCRPWHNCHFLHLARSCTLASLLPSARRQSRLALPGLPFVERIISRVCGGGGGGGARKLPDCLCSPACSLVRATWSIVLH